MTECKDLIMKPRHPKSVLWNNPEGYGGEEMEGDSMIGELT